MKLPTLTTGTERRDTITEQRIQEAVKDGVREALEEYSLESRERESGRRLPRLVLFGLALGATVYLLRKRPESVGEVVDDASQRVQRVGEEAGERTEEVSEETAERVRAGGRTAGEVSEEAAERIEESGEDVGERIEETGEQAADRMEETGDTSNDE